MTGVNMANRQCCDLNIQDYKTRAPWLYTDFCNTTIMGLPSKSVYANKKGQKCIRFNSLLDGTIAMIFQVHPPKVYAVLSNGEIEISAVITRKEIITCATTGFLILANTPVANAAFIYTEDDFGDKVIKGAAAERIFMTTTDSKLAVGTPYVIGYLERKESDVKKVSFNNKRAPRDFYIQTSALDKNEGDELVPTRIAAYRASPQRSLGLSFSSDGNPAEVTIIYDALVDDGGNMPDMIEVNNETE